MRAARFTASYEVTLAEVRVEVVLPMGTEEQCKLFMVFAQHFKRKTEGRNYSPRVMERYLARAEAIGARVRFQWRWDNLARWNLVAALLLVGLILRRAVTTAHGPIWGVR